MVTRRLDHARRDRTRMEAVSDGTTRAERSRGVLDVLDAAYDVEPDEPSWILGLTRAFAPLVDDGTGVHGFFVDLAAEPPLRHPVLVGGEPAWEAAWRDHWWDRLMLGLPPSTLRTMIEFGTASFTTHLWAATAARIETFAELLTRFAHDGFAHALSERAAPEADAEHLFYPESLNIVAASPTGPAVAIVANRRRTAERPLAARERIRWSRLSSHIAAALRLRQRVRSRAALEVGAEGVVDARGHVIHAEGAAKTKAGLEALRCAARDVVKARRASDAVTPLELWRGLHAGRWSVVETFDSDGKRFIVARENRPSSARSSAGLSAREREVLAQLALGHANKAIAYTLGITPATVATHLTNAARKLGARDVRMLVRIAREMARDA